MGERGIIVAGIAAQTAGLVALAVVASVVAQPWLFVLGALALAAGQGVRAPIVDAATRPATRIDEPARLEAGTRP